MEDVFSFLAFCDPQMDAVVWAGELHHASMVDYRHRGLDGTFVDPQAAVHLRGGSATIDVSTSATVEARKCAHYARPGCVSFI